MIRGAVANPKTSAPTCASHAIPSGEDSKEALQDKEDHHDLDDRQGRDPGDRQEEGDAVSRVEPPVRPKGREDSRRRSDE